jgi:WD40 repeat protein
MTPASIVALVAHIAPLVGGDRPRIELLLTLNEFEDRCSQFAVSPDGKWLALPGTKGQLLLSEVSDSKLRRPNSDKEQDTTIDPSEKRSPLVFLGSHRIAAAYTLQHTSGESEFGCVVLFVPGLTVESRFPGRAILALSPDGSTTLSVVFDPKEGGFTSTSFELWDFKKKKTLQTLNVGKHNWVESAEFRPDGKELLTRSVPIRGPSRPANVPIDRTNVRVFETATGKEVGSVKDVEKAASLSPDGSRFALDTGLLMAFPSPNRNTSLVSIKDRRTGEETYPPKGLTALQQGKLAGLHFLPDGRHVVVVTSLTVVVWDMTKDEIIKFGGKLSGAPVRVRFTQIENGLLFATVASNGDMQVWRVTLPK